ncbi:MAG: hypothetical protein ACR2PL_22125 [Dehalococcoidia bacterium]
MDSKPRTPSDLEEQFDQALHSICLSAHVDCNIDIPAIEKAVRQKDGLAMARELLHSSEFVEPLTSLWRCGRLDLSMEAPTFQPHRASLFSDGERAMAQRCLSDSAAKGSGE